MSIISSKAFYIKLGESGGWADNCIKNSTLRLGFNNPHHNQCLEGDWDLIRNYWRNKGKKTPGKATETTNQIKYFYESGEDVIWITFHNRKLYWCFSKKEISELSDGNRIRPTLGPWSCKDLKGNELTVESLSSRLTKTQGFPGTICKVEEAFEYLLRRINAEELPEVKEARVFFKKFKESLIPLIKNLTWQDFELLIDLIFTYAGWKRVETRGGPQKSIDLVLESPVTGKRAFVQIKSSADLSTFNDYIKQFKSMDQYDEMYFVVHSPKENLITYKGKHSKKIKIIDVERIAELSINSGLADWIIDKSK